MIDRDRLQSFKEKSGPRKERLGLLLSPDHGPWLLAVIRFLVHRLSEESIALGQYMFLSEILKPFPNPPKRLKRIFRTAYRLLKLDVNTQRSIPGVCPAETLLKLEKGWIRYFFNSTGLDLRDPFDLQAFRRLNTHMVIDTGIKLYYEAHPLVERAKAFLTGTLVTSSTKRKKLPDTPFIPPEIAADPDLPPTVPEFERLTNVLGQTSATGGRMTREEFDRVPTELAPDWNVDPEPEPDMTPSQFWKEQAKRQMSGAKQIRGPGHLYQ